MRTTFRYISISAVAIVSLAGCRDQRDPLAPKAPNAMIILQQPPIIQLPRPTDLMEIVAGDVHTCVRKRSGAVSCWGWNEYGQIGVTTTTQCGTFSSDGPCWKQPVLVTAPTNANFTSATHITAGSNHTCALEPSGAAWCWGYNYYGQIGKGTGGDQASPLMVAGGVSFTALAAGSETTCGTTSASQLLCWGEFPLAPGPTFRTYSPTVVANGVAFTAMGVANDHGCGNIGSNNWFCWGSNKAGQLATDTTVLQSSTPFTWVHALDGETNVAITGGTTCGDQSGSGALCFGHNRIYANNLSQFGLLGNPSFTGVATFVPQTPGPLHGVVVSSEHGCGLDASNTAWCWGVGDNGELGQGSNASSTAIVPVAGGHTYRALAVGRSHSCGIGTDNHVYCWGDNYLGQLGQPSASMYGVNTPVQTIDP
jgi:alpha-tubulin suppressor-like RCC1 family protein